MEASFWTNEATALADLVLAKRSQSGQLAQPAQAFGCETTRRDGCEGAAGVEFIDEDRGGPGVRLRKSGIDSR